MVLLNGVYKKNCVNFFRDIIHKEVTYKNDRKSGELTDIITKNVKKA